MKTLDIMATIANQYYFKYHEGIRPSNRIRLAGKRGQKPVIYNNNGRSLVRIHIHSLCDPWNVHRVFRGRRG